MEDELLVTLDDFKVLDENNPIAYTRDIHVCMVILIHKEKNTYMLHVEADDRSMDFGNFYELIKDEEDNKTISVDIFMGKYIYWTVKSSHRHSHLENWLFFPVIMWGRPIRGILSVVKFC